MRRRRHLLTTAPVAAYLLAHLLGRVYPSQLWGVDMLAYYGPVTTVIFLALPLIAFTLPDIRLPAMLRSMASNLGRVLQTRGAGYLLFLFSVPLLWTLRVRLHTLGDSIKWFAVIDNAVTHYRPFTDIAWHNASLKLPGLEFINFQQALDLVLHAGVFAILHTFGVTDARVSYEWISLLAGGAYVAALWTLAGRLTATPADLPGQPTVFERLAIFGSLMTLGTLQLFCGYGESYTLVTLVSALYLTRAIDSVNAHKPLWHAGVLLLICAAMHMLALSLVPSFVFLAWRHPRWGPLLQRPRVYVSLLSVAAVVAIIGYVALYRGMQLPLLTADAPGRYPVLSLRHALELTNALLLCGPFGLLWGLASLGHQVLRHRVLSVKRRFLGLAAAGAGALIGVHGVILGGRDWDLMSFPALFLAAWGVCSLQALLGAQTARSLARVVLPVMGLHTLLWIGINADATRADQRLENLLLGDSNQPDHYRAWTLGVYYLERDNAVDAANAFGRAVARAPELESNTPGTREFSYRKFHASALARAGDTQQALIEFRRLYALQPEAFASASDVATHRDWARAAFMAAESAAAAQDSDAARNLWEETEQILTRLLAWEDTRSTHRDLATVLMQLGKHERYINHRFLSISPEQDAVRVMIETGDTYLARGRSDLAAAAYGRLLGLGSGPKGLDAGQFRRVGIRLQKAGDTDSAILAFRQALALAPSSAENHRDLGWLLLGHGKPAAARQHLQLAVGLAPSAETMFTYAFACLAADDPDAAERAYAVAVQQHGSEAGLRVGAPDNLNWLIEQGRQSRVAGTIRQRYWPDR